MDNSTIFIVIKTLIICFASYFLLALNIIHIINMFKFYIPFSNEMVENDVYSKSSHKQLISGRWFSLIVFTAFIGGGLTWLSWITLPVGPIAAVASLALGIIRYRRLIGINAYNIKRFAVSHSLYILDKDKFKKYIEKKYNTK